MRVSVSVNVAPTNATTATITTQLDEVATRVMASSERKPAAERPVPM